MPKWITPAISGWRSTTRAAPPHARCGKSAACASSGRHAKPRPPLAHALRAIRRGKRMQLHQQALKTPHCGPTPARPPQSRATEQDRLLWALSTHRTVSAQDGTGAEFGLIERMMPASFASPAHIHHSGDEAFYVLEGEIRFQCGD